MRIWLKIIWRLVPPKLTVVALPFAIPLMALAIWFLIPKPPPDPIVVKRAEIARELEAVLVRAGRGDLGAQFRAGIIYRDGLAAAPDPGSALKWLTQAAHAGHAGSRFALGKMYEGGLGLRQSYAKAADWYRMAARAGGHAGAQYALGELYYSGRGVPHDFIDAIQWYRRAARQGHAAAQFVIGSMYEKGWGVDRDLTEAYYWYTLAARKPGAAQAVMSEIDPPSALAGLAKIMSRLELRRAEEKLAAVKAK